MEVEELSLARRARPRPAPGGEGSGEGQVLTRLRRLSQAASAL